MGINDLIEAAITESREKKGYSFCPALIESAITEGLVAGDIIHLGGKLYAHILETGNVSMREHGDNDQRETAQLTLDQMTKEQLDRMLVLKGIRAGRKGTTTG